MVVAGANVHDTKLLELTLENIVVVRPECTEEEPQNLCLDKGYDNPTGHGTVAAYGYQPHVRRIGEEKLDHLGEKGGAGRGGAPAIRPGGGWWNVPSPGCPSAEEYWCATTRRHLIS